ncbi:hypothetical protein ACF0H5_024333 [Mactra antiquata]
MKTRPESRQKTDEEASVTPSAKEKLVDNVFTAVAASKSSAKVPSLMRIKSAKSGKSLTKIAKAENTRNQAIKRLKGSRRDAKVTPKEDRAPAQPKNLPIWDDKLDKLCLSKKTAEIIDKEIGLRYFYITPPTPDIYDVKVQKSIPADRMNKRIVSVMKPVKKGYLYVSPDLLGPKYDKFGQIIPHSILGNVEDFIKHAHIQQKKTPVMPNPHKDTSSNPKVRTISEHVYRPHFNESKALETWNTEMKQRKCTQDQLADILARRVDNLLMYKSDMYDIKSDKIRFIEHYKQNYHPDCCFWNIPDQQGACQIRETITKSNRGYLPSPVICGDADSVLIQKGKVNKQSVCVWSENDYCKQRIQDTHGVIKISNNVLFDELDVRGVAIQSEDSSKKMNEKGDNKDTSKVHFKLSGETILAKTSDMHRKSSSGSYSGSYSITSETAITHEKMVCPALVIDGTVLQWRGITDGCNHNNSTISNKICKEVFVLIQSNVGEVKQGFAKIKNCGNTVIRYSWTKVPTQRLLPIPRPSRKYFYFIDDDGAIYPDETLFVPMLFRGRTPGYFTESWLLSTTPLLEEGAKVKFTFKGVATCMKDFSEQVTEIEDYLLRNQIATLCKTEVETVIDEAILKGSLQNGRLREDEPDPLSYEELFRLNNPRLYYHCHIVRKLEQLENSLSTDDIEKDQGTSINESPHVLSVMKLMKLVLLTPDDYDDHPDNKTPSISPATESVSKELLLRQLNEDITVLGMRPFKRMDARFQYRAGVMYTQLQGCIDRFVLYAWETGDKLRLSSIEEKTHGTEPKKETKGKTKGRAVKGGKKTTESPDLRSTSISTLTPDNKCEIPVFSNVHKCRQDETGRYTQKLNMYDEKVYIEMYRILSTAVEQMVDFFE